MLFAFMPSLDPVARVEQLSWPAEDVHQTKKRFVSQARSKTFSHILRHFRLPESSVLDIGCCNGEMLCHFGPGSVGVTINPEESTLGGQLGLDIRCGNIEAHSFELKESFQYIYCCNLLEHLFSPHSFLIAARRFLKPDGKLILGVPVFPRLTSLLRLRKFRGALADAHINFYTAETLAETVRRAGWEVEEVRSFVFPSSFLDRLTRCLMPVTYVIATPAKDFAYSEKRQIELLGYGTDVPEMK